MSHSLLANMREQISLYQKLLTLSQNTQAAIIKGDAEAVAAQTAEAWPLLEMAKSAEDERLLLMEAFTPETTITGLCTILPEAQGAELSLLGRELSELMAGLSTANELNQELLSLHFQYVNLIIDAASHKARPSNLYGASGQEKDEPATSLGLLDSQI